MKIRFLKTFWLNISVVFLLLSCGTIKSPVYKNINNLTLIKLGQDESSLTLQMNYFNPNNFGVKLKEVEGDAWLDNNYLGHFRMDSLIHIPANSDFSIPVKLEVDMKYVFQNAFTAIFNTEPILKIEGKAKLGKAGVFIHYSIHYEDKQNFAELFK